MQFSVRGIVASIGSRFFAGKRSREDILLGFGESEDQGRNVARMVRAAISPLLGLAVEVASRVQRDRADLPWPGVCLNGIDPNCHADAGGERTELFLRTLRGSCLGGCHLIDPFSRIVKEPTLRRILLAWNKMRTMPEQTHARQENRIADSLYV
jgi:hypothetical protein